MNTSPEAVSQIADFEGLRLIPYNDIAGNATIGVGHLLHLGPVQSTDVGLTRDQALSLFSLDLKTKSERFITKYVKVPLQQGQFDALSSFTFNLGCGTLLNLLSETGLNHGDYSKVPAEILCYDKAHVDGKLVSVAGLDRRRQWEAEQWKI